MRCKKKLLVAAMFLLLHGAPVYAVDLSLNIQQISHLAIPADGDLADVWGWYDSQNNRYYGLACDHANITGGVYLIETTSPENPIIIGKLFDSGPGRQAVDVMVSGDYAFVANQTAEPGEIWIYHLPTAVTNPNGPPVKVLKLDDYISNGDTIPIYTCHELFVTDDYLFLAEGPGDLDGIREAAVLKISNGASPAQPQLLDVWDQYGFDTGVYWYPHNFYVRGDTAFIFVWSSGVYRVIFNGANGQIISWKKIWYDGFRGDVANVTPYDSINCSDLALTRKPFSHSGWLSDNGQAIFVADEGLGYGTENLECAAAQAPSLRAFAVSDFWDTSDPSRDTVISPVNAFDILWRPSASQDSSYVGAAAIDLAAPSVTPCPVGDCAGDNPDEPNYLELGIHNPHVKDNLLFVSWYGRGLQILDIADIANMKRAGFYDRDGWQAGYWGVYPYSPDGYIYCSGSGFSIYRYGYTGTLDTNATWQGDVYIYDTLTVASNIRLSISARTNIYMFKDALLKVDGKLVVNGVSGDSVKFIALGGNPQPGDWRGIYVDQAAVCSLSYCSVSLAEYGLESRNNAQITILNSNFHDNEVAGIYCYKSYTSISNSRFEENGVVGVDGLNADVDVYGSRFVDNALYGIRLSGCWTSDNTLIEYDTLSCSSSPSYYAISITNIDSARVYKCKARTYTQAGLYLSGSDALVQNNDFSMNTNYGIYAYNASFPKIRQCRIDTLSIGVKTSDSKPNLGTVYPNDPGNCSFLSCSSYYIYHSYNPKSPDTLYAQNNYYGGNPFQNKFYWSDRYSPIKYTPYLALPPSPPRLEVEHPLPFVFDLRQNYPNPFNPTTTISFTLDEPAYTNLSIYNLLGQRIVSIVDEFMGSGEHVVIWNGRNGSGEPGASGIYFYLLQSGGNAQAQKMTLLR